MPAAFLDPEAPLPILVLFQEHAQQGIGPVGEIIEVIGRGGEFQVKSFGGPFHELEDALVREEVTDHIGVLFHPETKLGHCLKFSQLLLPLGDFELIPRHRVDDGFKGKKEAIFVCFFGHINPFFFEQ